MFTSQLALAGFVFSPSVSYLERDLNDNGTETEAKLSMVDLRLGYQLDMGLYLGGIYSIASEDILGGDTTNFLVGPSVGYFYSGFLAIITYHLFGERDLSVGNQKYSGGKRLTSRHWLCRTHH